MDFLANIIAQILMELLIYRHAKDKVMWVSLFVRSLLTLQMIFMLATLVFTIYECCVGITDKNFTQFMGDFFKFHFVTVQPWAILGLSFCALAFAYTIPVSTGNSL
jgi:hypothetical protein